MLYALSLTRVERTEYERGDQQRSDVEWKFGMGMRSQNAFGSGYLKKARVLVTSRGK